MSHYMTPGDETIVTLEMADGTVYRGKARVATLSVHQSMLDCTFIGDAYRDYVPGILEWDVQLTGLGMPTMTMGEARQYVKRQRTAREWACEYCGAVMPKAERKCGGCGAWRSFLYDV